MSICARCSLLVAPGLACSKGLHPGRSFGVHLFQPTDDKMLQEHVNGQDKVVESSGCAKEKARKEHHWIELGLSAFHFWSQIKRRGPRIGFDTSDGASHDETMSPHSPVPLGTDAFDLDVLKACFGEPVHVFFFRWEEHPCVGEESGNRMGGMHRSNQAC